MSIGHPNCQSVLKCLLLYSKYSICMTALFTVSKQAFNEPLVFATVHSLMNDINLIDCCKAQRLIHMYLFHVVNTA